MTQRPNIIYIMSDDHAAHAVSAYGSVINRTPNIDRIATDGARLDNVFCTNAICTPSRASILTGTYSHVNGVRRLHQGLDQSQPTVDKELQDDGYQTAVVGKWHLGHGEAYDPRGFDYWCILPDQGDYHDPEMIEQGRNVQFDGYVTDIVTDRSLEWLDQRDRERPFCLMVHHKAPHRPWEPAEKHAALYEDLEMPLPRTFDDDYATRASAAKAATMRIIDDIIDTDTKGPVPAGLMTTAEVKNWKYQRFIKDYLRCVASVDDNVGRILDYLDENDLTQDTVVVYTSDQGFFLGDHGWYDKRFFYEESIRMPFLIRYPREIPAGSSIDEMVLNVDFPALLLDYAGRTPPPMQGRSFRPVLNGHTPGDWRTDMYYRYFDYPGDCNNYAHFGLRTKRYKLVMYYEPGPVEWELFDLETDPDELVNLHGDHRHAELESALRHRLDELRRELGETDWLFEETLGDK